MRLYSLQESAVRLALAFCLFVGQAHAGSMTLLGVGKTAAAGCSDTNATAWAAAVVTAGGTVSGAQQTRVCTLIQAYKSAGVWTILAREWLEASENVQQASIDIVNLSTLTLNGSPVFTANRGYSGSLGTEYIDTGYTPASPFTLNSLSFGVYIFAPSASASAGIPIGYFGPYTYLRANSPNLEFDADEAQFYTVANPSGFSAGNFVVTRTASNAVAFYRNTAASALSSQTDAPNVLPTGNIFVLAANNGSGTPTQFFTGTIASFFMGGGLTQTQAAAKNAALNVYMTAIGANVY